MKAEEKAFLDGLKSNYQNDRIDNETMAKVGESIAFQRKMDKELEKYREEEEMRKRGIDPHYDPEKSRRATQSLLDDLKKKYPRSEEIDFEAMYQRVTKGQQIAKGEE